MAKKKKKMIKLNQSIRHFFGDEGFDEGIERVPTDVLVALAHTLGVFNGTTDKTGLIKTFRRIWSEGESDNREMIVSFFKHEGKIYPNPKPKEKPHEREEKINEMLEGFDITPEERRALHASFIDIRTRKITPEKIASKLEHIRYTRKREQLEKALEGKFNFDDSLEYYASITYHIDTEIFTKIHILKTAPLNEKRLHEESIEVLVPEITELKTALTTQKQEQTNLFLSSLNLSDHRYLTKEQIIASLKSAPPSTQTYGTLSVEILRDVLARHLHTPLTSVTNDDLIVEIDKQLHLPHRIEPLEYTLSLHLDIHELSRQIWNEEELTITTMVEEQSIQEERIFLQELEHLVEECRTRSKLLEIDDESLYEIVYELLLPYLTLTPHISSKTSRRVLFAYDQRIAGELLKRQRQALLARTVRDFKNLFPLARSLRRRLIFHTGPTNSGKTYTAFQQLKKAGTGYYLAPLRLLALEGYENLREQGVSASLITGEEQLLDEDATHISSTIEMLSFESEVDCCVIDEVQMIDDRDRGWAWANAIIGAPAKTVIMTGSPNAKEAIIALAEYLGEPLEIIEFERKNPLELLKSPTPITAIEPKTAVIAFTRSNALRLKQQLSKTYRTSVIYGNLSPEVRREEARRFREGETDILVATDAISMGLNLPIKTLLFSKADKFDGQNQRNLTATEVRQISGRAGRYGLSEKGYVGALTADVLKTISSLFTKAIEPIVLPFNVMANFDHIMLVSNILEEKSLSNIVDFFVRNMKFEGPFRAANLESMQEASAIVDRYDLDMRTKYTLATAPLSTSSPLVMAAFERYVRALEQKKPIAYIPPQRLGLHALSMEELQEAEDRIKEISLYLWLSYRLGEFFVDAEKARTFRGELNRFIENSLQQSHFVPRCKTCGKPLAPNAEFSICQSCFNNLNRSKAQQARSNPAEKKYSSKRR
ncbi:helicase domain protein [Sulfuricurvum kujiense DSM 16994]|uniref:Helicase domain protein n=1 Tax=Sulfuricurvum kujiense (strain ATCC BAA-921 / DSM 16994 / JCM 11577 / YK-1) TaxID=709032 RepID=E4TWB7_SULKY|nr:helicase-related protein [Sulfuricurvum kujiense]ADR32733.1 helicase domain protein [Sulfuricurvum kujiense DSM 16994]